MCQLFHFHELVKPFLDAFLFEIFIDSLLACPQLFFYFIFFLLNYIDKIVAECQLSISDVIELFLPKYQPGVIHIDFLSDIGLVDCVAHLQLDLCLFEIVLIDIFLSSILDLLDLIVKEFVKIVLTHDFACGNVICFSKV